MQINLCKECEQSNIMCKKCKRKEYQKKHYQENKERIRERHNKHYQEHKEEAAERQRKMLAALKDDPEKREKYLAVQREKDKRRYNKKKNDTSFKINNSIRGGIRRAIKEAKVNRHWESLVGYTLSDLMSRLESQFEPWMNWDNYGVYEEGKQKWHIDHIKPQSWFPYSSTEEEAFKQCWALSNLQPLEASENMTKRNKYEG